MLPKLLMLLLGFVTSLLVSIHDSQASMAKPGCQEICGNATIPYPFGIGTGCYLYESFEVLCEGSSQDPYPLRFANMQKFPILEFSTNLVRMMQESRQPSIEYTSWWNVSIVEGLLDQYFSYSVDHNLFVAVGCNILTNFMYEVSDKFLCDSTCNETFPFIGSATSCTGFNGCCQLRIPKNTTSYRFLINYNTNRSQRAHAFISENSAPIYFDKQLLQLSVALNWVVALTTCHQAIKSGDNMCGMNSYCVDSTNGLGYNCHCIQDYEGNPYLPNGCQVKQIDINDCMKQSNHSCEEGDACVYKDGSYKCISKHHHKSDILVTLEIVAGVFAFVAFGYWTYIKLDRIRRIKRKKRLFTNNGGHLLKQQISGNKLSVMTIKVYTVEEMKKSTENFSRSRFLGKGGQGTVYKGLFPDGTTIAVKKSNVIDANQVERFVNEIFILAQINHRNIVRLLGCCLEYEVPLLVYEYLENDTLSQYLHDGKELSKLSWKERIRC